MKVGLLGNMNNMMFALARLLRRSGVDAELMLYDEEFAHFHPSFDTYDIEYMSYTRQLSWGSGKRFLSTPARDVRDALAPYDVLVGCGLAPAYCSKVHRRLDIFIPYGGDLLLETRFRLVRPDHVPSVWAAAVAQRRGISQASVVHAPRTETFEERLQRLYGGERWFCGVPLVDAETYDPVTLRSHADQTHWSREFRRIRDDCDLVLMSAVRHFWGTTSNDPHRKGSETLFRGFKAFIDRRPEVRAKLVTLEYGRDVARSRKLVSELNIERHVAWLPQMARKDLMVGLSFADVVCAEFDVSFVESGSRYEALAAAKPLLAFRRGGSVDPDGRELYPILNANSPEAFAERIEEYVEDPAPHADSGLRGRKWYEDRVVTAAREKYLSYIGSG